MNWFELYAVVVVTPPVLYGGFLLVSHHRHHPGHPLPEDPDEHPEEDP